jgi:hypothetical protein
VQEQFNTRLRSDIQVKKQHATAISSFMSLSSLLVFLALSSLPCHAQGNTSTQIAGVEQTRTGAYQALADLCYEAYKRGDEATAAKTARILERTWDKGEARDGEDSVRSLDPALYRETDAAMDAFIKPVLQYSTKTPDLKSVTETHNAFIEKLRLADRPATVFNGVQVTRTGTYRALAELSYESFKKGETANANKIGTILLWTWNKDEKDDVASCRKSLRTSNPTLFEKIDAAMNTFLDSVGSQPAAAPDFGAVRAAYDGYLEKLQLGDSEFARPAR